MNVSYYNGRLSRVTSDLSCHCDLATYLGWGCPGCSTLSRENPWWSCAAPGPMGAHPWQHPGTVLPERACCIHDQQVWPVPPSSTNPWDHGPVSGLTPAARSLPPAGVEERIRRAEVRKLKGWDKESLVGKAKAMKAAKEEQGIHSALAEQGICFRVLQKCLDNVIASFMW